MSFKEKISSLFKWDSNLGNNNFHVKNAPNSNGNSYEFIETLKAINNSTLMTTGEFYESKNQNSDTDITNYLNSHNLQDWFLLQIQANYYVNSIRFDCSNPLYFLELKRMIRASFIYGKAGFYFDKLYNRWFAVLISKENGLYRLYRNFGFDKEYQMNDNTPDYVIDNPNDLVIFHWGDNNQSAIIYQFPFVKLQNQVLKQMSLSSLVLSKKLLYKSDAPNPSLKEIKNWLNPFKFVLQVFNTTTKRDGGKFEWVSNDGADNVEKEMFYYEKLIQNWYSLFGRRVNTDFKKERNITDEVQSSQENYDILQANYKDCFKIFLKELSLNINSNTIGEIKYYE